MRPNLGEKWGYCVVSVQHLCRVHVHSILCTLSVGSFGGQGAAIQYMSWVLREAKVKVDTLAVSFRFRRAADDMPVVWAVSAATLQWLSCHPAVRTWEPFWLGSRNPFSLPVRLRKRDRFPARQARRI